MAAARAAERFIHLTQRIFIKEISGLRELQGTARSFGRSRNQKGE
jgi:hypothetical protein